MKKTRKNKKTKSIFRYIAFALVGIIIGVFIYNQNAKSVVGDKMPMPLGYGVTVVLSGSMEDTLSVDDLVIIKKTDEFKENDIVVYQDGNSLVLHRIINIDGDTVTTKGDANNVADAPIQKSQIKGVLVYDIPRLGAVVHIIRKPIFLFIILAAALLLPELSYRKEKDDDEKSLDEIKAEIEKLKQDENT
ncbi:MAG: signal peptidase I [Acutalibacteraceae bacterium]|nr:signal peptidase I [Acutalibacteraceae bacterium]